MRVDWTSDAGVWRLTFLLDPEDETTGTCADGQRLELRTNTCHVRLPRTREPYAHPDLLAVAAWTVAAPWTRRRVTFDRPISAGLAEALRTGWGVDAGPVGEGPREGTRLAISYSGGADSMAVADVFPDAPFVHFERVSHPRVPNRWTHYRSDVLARLARETGRDVTIVRSDLEFVLDFPRPGYPEHHAVAAGALLLADDMDLGGLAFGYELGSRWLGGDRYLLRFTPDNPMWSAEGPWGRLFAAAGLPVVLPVGGVSEAVTMRIALGSDLREQVRWCLRGSGDGPCGKCGKCLYKELIQAAVERRPLRTSLTAGSGVARRWQEPPPYGGQEMIEYGCAHVPGIETTPFARAAEHLGATEESTRWLERCYPPAIGEIPERWRGQVEAYILDNVGLMTSDDARRVETWGTR
ncbi:DUF6395 domain-containing protein [Planotetraspora sp. A-T 1434]|uniref:DUF6395 domain-containing protein n=1 Tax=Planotetraspora sp. A-T 1434 TaxID=2979219 RepID=UPI0021BE6412|nr:DUF6395 domain-containing protein [Planotetraspora sp. A-T 1434]MCT9931354.1 DUF6395 domain-containing protein [Planotetraspora sp. A-T 1434]